MLKSMPYVLPPLIDFLTTSQMDHITAAVMTHPELAERYSNLGQLFDKK